MLFLNLEWIHSIANIYEVAAFNIPFQNGVILGTFLGVLHMGQSHGGSGGVIINVASLAGVSALYELFLCFE